MNNEWAITCRLSPISARLCFTVLISFAPCSFLWADSLIMIVVFHIFCTVTLSEKLKVHCVLQNLERWKENLCQYSPCSHVDVGAAKGSAGISPNAPDGQSVRPCWHVCRPGHRLFGVTHKRSSSSRMEIRQAGEDLKDGVTYCLTWISLCIWTWITLVGLKAQMLFDSFDLQLLIKNTVGVCLHARRFSSGFKSLHCTW